MTIAQPQAQSENTHFYWIDLVRMMAVLQVVLVHLSYVIFFKEEVLSANWRAANFYDSFSRMGVPLFFMVSGYLLLGKHEPIGEFFRKRFWKVDIPTLFWSAVYLLWSVKAYMDGTMTFRGVALSMLKAMYEENVEIHLWFLYILVGIYLVVPILCLFVSAASRRDLNYFAVIWFLATPLLELSGRVLGLQTPLVIPVVAGYVGYFMLGDVRLERRGMTWSVFGFISAIAVTYVGTNLLSAQAGPIDAYFYSYFSPPTVLASICGYLFLKEAGSKLGRSGGFVRTLSATSFGIFLVYIFVIELLRNGNLGFRLYSRMAPSIYMIPVTALAVFVLSFVIVYVWRKIPVLKMLVP